jgi:pimeloyl-ACP methyl ester carboxylesterase
MNLSFCLKLCGFAIGLAVFFSGRAEAFQLVPAFHQQLIGPRQATGAVIYSHGRSIDSEDSLSPTPPYLTVLQRAGWDVLRLNRMRAEDNLNDSTRELAARAAQLKRMGYRKVALVGQSFGAFLSLMAADRSDDVNAVVATAPAAFGDFEDFYGSWRLNATRLYPLLEDIKRARVMLFYFHDDDFDPGGRGDRSRAILAQRGLGWAVIDQPPYMTGHWASTTGMFMRRYGDCVLDFAQASGLKGEMRCRPQWGEAPSRDLRVPANLIEAAPPGPGATGASEPDFATGEVAHVKAARQTFYGFYPNGREVLVSIARDRGSKVTALYAIGPGIDGNEPAQWVTRDGRLIDGEFVFQHQGKSTLRFDPSPNGGVHATWTSPDGKEAMQAAMRRINMSRLPDTAAAR